MKRYNTEYAKTLINRFRSEEGKRFVQFIDFLFYQFYDDEEVRYEILVGDDATDFNQAIEKYAEFCTSLAVSMSTPNTIYK